MNALGSRHLVAALATLTSFWLGCAQSSAPSPAEAPQQPQVNPKGPPPEPPQCKSDAECAGGEVCDATVHAACDTCDGGKVITVCMQPRSCAEQKDCLGNRTCTGSVCR